jgi:ATP-dependent exoDNAse (exonuclease V) beta subunit
VRTNRAEQRRKTYVGRTRPRSLYFITVRRGRGVTEAQTQTRRSQRQETAGEPPEFDGWWHTRNLRRCFSACGFLLSGYNDLGAKSGSFRHPIILSGSGNESAHLRRLMSQHYRISSHNHRTTDVSTDNHHDAPPECPACDRQHITVEGDLWRCTLCNAGGVLGGVRA